MLLGTAAVWGATFVTVQEAIQEIEPASFLAWRFALSAAVLFLVIVGRHSVAFSWAEVRGGIVMGLFLGGGYLCQTLGLTGTSVSNAAFVTSLFAVLTPIFGAIVLRQRASTAVPVAAGFSVVGVFFLTGTSGRLNPADAIVLLGACSFAAHVLATDAAVKSSAPLRLTFIQMLVVTILCVVLSWATGGLTSPEGASVWSAVVVVGVLAGAGGYFVQTYAQSRLPPSEVALILISESLFASAASLIFQRIEPTLPEIVGAGLILAALVLVIRAPGESLGRETSFPEDVPENRRRSGHD